nr:hypothetical protein GCM10010200_103800 [Actinomadura rugatobispora]
MPPGVAVEFAYRSFVVGGRGACLAGLQHIRPDSGGNLKLIGDPDHVKDFIYDL